MLFGNLDLILNRWGQEIHITTDPFGAHWHAWVDGDCVGSGNTFDDVMVDLLERFGMPEPEPIRTTNTERES